eukprot:4184053-Heterocapsa_arctica.AAC.1
MASESGEHPPHYDDVLCPYGGWHFVSALVCTCGLPSAKYRHGDWLCKWCRHSNFASKKFCGGRGG